MKLRWSHTLFAALGLSFSSPAPAQGDGEIEYHDELIHSDVPLWGSGDATWPQSFSSEDGFGCASRVSLGDWLFTDFEGGEESWWRLGNYGVFHCGIVEYRADERADLDEGFEGYAFMVEIGSTTIDGDKVELWALQSGTRPGSDYTLLSRSPGDGVVAWFQVLQRQCPKSNNRKGPALDSWITGYCAINSQAELVRLARRMAKLPPLGRLEFIKDSDSEPVSSED